MATAAAAGQRLSEAAGATPPGPAEQAKRRNSSKRLEAQWKTEGEGASGSKLGRTAADSLK